MKEFKEYDCAAEKFYSKHSFKSLPLEAWDIFSMAYEKCCTALEEVNKLKAFALLQNWNDISFFEKEVLNKKHVVVITDTDLNIVHASNNIYQMNGYHPKEIMGKKPKIFQGEETSEETTNEIRIAIKELRPFEAVILNYRKDGTSYRCWIKGQPIKNRKGKVVNFIAFEKEVA